MKLLVVDDDREIVSVIMETIDWSALGLGEVRCAYHLEGAEPILLSGVDIVISDVEMPRGTGLELIRWARENGIESEFIFLTCHDSFGFVQEAMRYRAQSYVLKPFDRDEIIAEVLKAVDRVRRNANLSSCETLWQENKAAVEQRFWRDFLLLDDVLEQGVLSSRLDNRGIDIDKAGQYRLVLVKLAKAANPAGESDEELHLFEHRGTQLVAEEILRDPAHAGRIFHFERYGWQYAGCILEDRGEADAVERCGRFVERYKAAFSEYITCYPGKALPLALLPRERARLEEMSHREYRSGVILQNDAGTEPEAAGALLDVSRVQEQLAGGEKLALMRDMKAQLETLMAEGRLNIQTMFAIRQALAEEVYRYLSQHDLRTEFLFADGAYCFLQFNAHASIYDMIKWMNYLFTKVIGQEQTVREESSVVAQALTYIHTHYTEDITREEVARHVCLAPAYFAKQFKKEKGVTVKDYINYCRVTAACERLRSSNRSIIEIANQVGFSDSSYFTVVFRKIIGLSPSEYRQAHQAGKASL